MWVQLSYLAASGTTAFALCSNYVIFTLTGRMWCVDSVVGGNCIGGCGYLLCA
ncbi:unnamed protein product, partial [Cercopithifilaria johnstoni]